MTVLVTPDGAVPVQGPSAAPLAGTYRAGAPMFGLNRGIDLIGRDHRTSYGRIFREQPWVYSVVTKLARAAARLPLKVYEDDGDGNKTRLRPPNELAALYASPFPRGSAFKLKEAQFGSLLVYGHSLAVMGFRRPGAPPTELWPLPWQYVTPIRDDEGNISHYYFNGPAGRRVFVAENCVHLQFWGPEGVGVSPLEPLRRTLQLEDGAQRHQIASFANGARLSGVLKKENGTFAKGQREELRAEIAATYQGVDNAFRIALLDGGLSWQPMAQNAQESEVIATRKLTREEVCAAYNIDPTQVGILDRATFSNVTEAHKSFYVDTVGPLTTMYEEETGAQLIEPRRTNYGSAFIEFDFSELLRPDLATRSVAYQRQRDSSVATPNELRAAENRPPIGDPDDPENPANQLFVPVNVVPLSHAGVLLSARVSENDPTAALTDHIISELERRGHLQATDPAEENPPGDG
jgi:HK97 family phage portal protein